MFVLIGLIIVIVSLLGGFTVAGGKILNLIVPAEYIIIIGVATGALMIANPLPVLIRIIGGALGILKGPKVSKAAYLELLKLLYELFQFAKREGLIALEPHVEKPESSSILSKYRSFLSNHHAVHFLCDTLKVILSGGVPAHDLDELMELDLESMHEEEEIAPNSLNTMADGFPGLGIVAAVCGVIVTMGSINEGPEMVGHHIAGALVGTFLGVMACYGIIGPIAQNMAKIVAKEHRYLMCIKAALLSFAKGAPGSVAIEYGRRAIDPEFRPSFKETEEAVKVSK